MIYHDKQHHHHRQSKSNGHIVGWYRHQHNYHHDHHHHQHNHHHHHHSRAPVTQEPLAHTRTTPDARRLAPTTIITQSHVRCGGAHVRPVNNTLYRLTRRITLHC